MLRRLFELSRCQLLVHDTQLEIRVAIVCIQVNGALEGGKRQLVLSLRCERPSQVLEDGGAVGVKGEGLGVQVGRRLEVLSIVLQTTQDVEDQGGGGAGGGEGEGAEVGEGLLKATSEGGGEGGVLGRRSGGLEAQGRCLFPQ
eukprot:evm.model.NODE_6037_length_1758_cov_13.795222.1